MVKCCPKPNQISARQFKILFREEKKARLLPLAPPSPRAKKSAHTRRSRYDVSLARKKQVKVKTRLVIVRRARTESSLAFSAMYVDIPGGFCFI